MKWGLNDSYHALHKNKKILTSNNCPETLACTVQQYHSFFLHNSWEINRFHIVGKLIDSISTMLLPTAANVPALQTWQELSTFAICPILARQCRILPFCCSRCHSLALIFFSVSLYLIMANNIESKNVHGPRHNKITKWHNCFRSEAWNLCILHNLEKSNG